MSDKDFKVKNKLVVKGITTAGPITSDAAGNIDSVPHIATQFGGTGTTTSPSTGQILYSSSGTTYAPTTLNTLDVKGASYSADAPSSPVVGQIWVESDTSSDSFDPNIIRRKTFTATAAQTVFTTDLEFIQGYEQVFFNGMLLIRNSDYTTASNTNVTLAAGAAAGDIVEVVSITNLNSINTATTTTNTFTGIQTIKTTVNAANSNLKIISDGTADSIELFRATSPGILTRSYNGTYDSPTAGTINQRTGFIIASSYDGSVYSNNAALTFWNTENTTPTARGSHILFETTAIGGTSRAERMRIMGNGKITIGSSSIYTTTTPTTAKLTIISDSNLNDTDTNSFISLRNKNNTNANTVVGGILSDTYRDIADPHYSAGMWFIREPHSGNASSKGAIVFGTEGNVSSLALPTERMRIASNGDIAMGSGQSVDTLRYFDIYNTHSGASAGTIIRLITNNAANTAVTTVDIVKYRNGTFLLANNDTGATAIFQFNNAGSERMRIDGNGSLLVGYTGTNSASYKLQVNSQIFATSSSIATSDGRYKENVDTITSGLNIVDSLRPVSFTWKDHPVHNFVAGKTVGFIAQEVKEALSEYDWVDNIIKTNTSDAILDEEGNEVTPAEEFLGIAESNIIPLLVAAVKELKARVETLEANNV